MPLYECVNDRLLLEALEIPVTIKEHLHGKGNICSALKKGNNLKGIVDEDPHTNPPSYYKKLKKLDSGYGINLYTDKPRKNSLIELSPDLENWLINFFKTHKIDFKKENIPENSYNFKILSKEQRKKVAKLIRKLSGKIELQTLKQYLK